MEPSPRKNLSAATATILLLVILTAESSKSFADGCQHLSGSYRGACWPLVSDDACNIACTGESSDNFFGVCDSFKCWCLTKCHSEIVAPASTPILP
ncbi:unnamed protein product [Urochloa decumbens]|uniref:Knottin scorpion toxin-like domain-containing protein n=1 Tax=Urochloa decumbens TaxID=240449 RepID=A0ABC9D5L8_9POAL